MNGGDPAAEDRIGEHGGGLRAQCDVVVVGSGAGGAVAAWAAAAAGLDVVLLEEGGRHGPESYSRDPAEAFRKLYRNAGATSTLGVPWIPLPLGRCLGGTTVINSGTCFRIPGRVLDAWRGEHGLSGLDPGELEACYAEVEEILGVGPTPREHYGGNAEVFLRGAERLGWSHGPLLRNAPGCRGCGLCVQGCPSGAKRSTLLSFIPMAEAAGARVYTDCRVDRVEVLRGRATAVRGRVLASPADGRRPGRTRGRLHVAARAVVVSCGAIHTPVLLSASGLSGRGRALGRNLAIHPATRVIARMEDEVAGWRGVPQGTMVDAFHDEDILMEGVFVTPGLLAAGLPGLGTEVREPMADYRRLAAYGAMVHDSSRGRVLRIPGLREPIIRYHLNRRDAAAVLRSMALVAEALFAAGALEVYPGVHGAGVLRSMDDVRAFAGRSVRARDLEIMAFHPQGTCRMGADDGRAVLDAQGRHRQVENLLVADASVFPTALGVNPMLTIQALALRNTRRLVDRLL